MHRQGVNTPDPLLHLIGLRNYLCFSESADQIRLTLCPSAITHFNAICSVPHPIPLYEGEFIQSGSALRTVDGSRQAHAILAL